MAARAPAPEPLAIVERFINTLDLEDGPELLPDPSSLRAWLAEAGLLDRDATVGPDEHDRAVTLREALRDVLSGRSAAIEHVNAAGERAGLRPVLRPDSSSALEPAAGGVDGALGRIVALVHGAVADGTRAHLKACEREPCRWVFYDHSKNHSGRWCDMQACGAREKSARAYRRRRDRESAKRS
jgi:predicted RNA-binding Zn ribbon-like protein